MFPRIQMEAKDLMYDRFRSVPCLLIQTRNWENKKSPCSNKNHAAVIGAYFVCVSWALRATSVGMHIQIYGNRPVTQEHAIVAIKCTNVFVRNIYNCWIYHLLALSSRKVAFLIGKNSTTHGPHIIFSDPIAKSILSICPFS